MLPKRETQSGQAPVLAPLFGSDKKPRHLDKEVASIGRARGCDITLDANEVSAVHCIFFRSMAGGFRIRDCGSRTGTRLNGANVKNSRVADGDVLQIGPFSFEIRLPATTPATPKIDPQQWERVRHSRRNLVRLALQLRRRLRQSPDRDQGLTEKAADLQAKIRGYDQRLPQ